MGIFRRRPRFVAPPDERLVSREELAQYAVDGDGVRVATHELAIG